MNDDSEQVADDGAPKHPNAEAPADEATSPSTGDGAGTGDAADTGDTAFDALWSRVVSAWPDDKPHHALIEYAVRAHKLPEAAGLYKTLSDAEGPFKDDATKRELAQKRLNGVVMAATQLLLSTKTSAPTKTPLMWNITAVVMCGVILSYLTYRIFLSRGH